MFMRLIFVSVLLFCFYPNNAQTRHGKVGAYASYKGLVMAGYQGWFRTPGDGTGNSFGHYGRNGKFEDGNSTVDFWPDVTEYKKTYETSFKYPDGSPGKVFSSAD